MPILQQLRIVDTWKILGGGELQGRPPHLRGRAHWRSGDDFNISIDTDKNCYYDFVTASGGGVLRLVEVARACDQAEALRWLINNLALDDTSNTISPAQRAAAQRERRESEAFEEGLQPAYRRFLRELQTRRDQLISILRVVDYDAWGIELCFCYEGVDSMRRAIADYVDVDAVELTIAIVDLIAEAA